MTAEARGYLPALRFHWATGLYDRFVAWSTRERTFRRALVEQVAARPGERVLDVACGTATLALAIKAACPEAAVAGVDADRRILAIARRKVAASGLEVALSRGMSQALPFGDRAFDRVVSSLFFHHVLPEDKRRTLAEIGRVLRPGGVLHVADWGRPQNAAMRAAFLAVQCVDGFARTRDNVRGLLPRYLAEAGFSGVTELARFATPLGTLSLYRGTLGRGYDAPPCAL